MDADRARLLADSVAGRLVVDAVPIDTRFFAAGTAIRFASVLAFVTVDSLTLLSTTLVQYREGDE